MSNLGTAENRGACKKCGLAGHLSYMCRNTISLNENSAGGSSEVVLLCYVDTEF